MHLVRYLRITGRRRLKGEPARTHRKHRRVPGFPSLSIAQHRTENCTGCASRVCTRHPEPSEGKCRAQDLVRSPTIYVTAQSPRDSLQWAPGSPQPTFLPPKRALFTRLVRRVGGGPLALLLLCAAKTRGARKLVQEGAQLVEIQLRE